MDGTEDFTDRLRAVFDLCDADRQGFITVAHFVDLAREHFGAEKDQDLNDIVNLLDTEGDGRIYFDDFCRGVKQILEIQASSSPTTPSPIYERHFTLHNIGSEETLVAGEEDSNSCGTHETSELSTYNEYDMMTDDDQGNMATCTDLINLSPDHEFPHLNPPRSFLPSEDDRDSAIGTSENKPDNEVTDEEERFEDYGEGESETDTSHNTTNDSGRHLTPGSNRRTNASAHALASQLYRVAGSSAGTSRRSSCSDEIFDDIDTNFMDLNDKVQRLESQIHLLNENQSKTDQRHVRLKDENSFLVERVHQLEEQLRDVEVRGRNELVDEQRKHRELMSRTDKDKTREIEILSSSLGHIEKEYHILKEEAPRLRQEVDRLRRDNAHLEDKVSELQYALSALSDEHHDVQERAQEQRTEMEQEREVHAQLLDELSKELEELRAYKGMNQSGQVQAVVTPGDAGLLRRRELEAYVVRLKEENARLREQNEDMQAQLLNRQIEEGCNLLKGNTSLAAELDNLPRDELVKNLQEQQEVNKKLQEYMDNLMLKIMESNPTLLEIQKKDKKS